MTLEGEDLREELLTVLAASRELPQRDDAALVSIMLERLEAYATNTRPVAASGRGLINTALGASELAAGLLAGAVGFAGLDYIRQQFDAAAAVGALGPAPVRMQDVVVAGAPAVQVLGLLLVALIVSTLFHTVTRWRIALGLQFVSTLLLLASGTAAVSQSGTFLAPLIFIHYVQGGAVPALATVTGSLAVLASAAGVMRQVDRRRWPRAPWIPRRSAVAALGALRRLTLRSTAR